MNRLVVFLVLLFVSHFVVASVLDSSAPWPTLRGNQERTGQSSISFSFNSTIKKQWQRSLSQVCYFFIVTFLILYYFDYLLFVFIREKEDGVLMLLLIINILFMFVD